MKMIISLSNLSNLGRKVSIPDQIKAWCLSPLGMIIILIIFAALGVVTGMAIKENCAENDSDLPYRIFRVFFIAAYVCFALVFANSLIAKIYTAISDTLAKIMAKKWSATLYYFTMVPVYYGIAILIYSMQFYKAKLDEVQSLVRGIIFSAPFWVAGSIQLIICPASIYHSGGGVFGGIILEVIAFLIALYLAAELSYEANKAREEKLEKKTQSMEADQNSTKQSEQSKENPATKIVDTIISETTRVAQKI